jgi:hypothetical protein
MNIQSIEQDKLLVANNFSTSVTYSEKVPDVGQPGTTPAVAGNMFLKKVRAIQCRTLNLQRI